MKVSEIIRYLDSIFPLELQEPYDNTGGQVIFNEETITGILVALDFDSDVLNEAVKKKCSLIVTHHPFIFRSIKKISSGTADSDLLVNLIDKRISLYAAHTNLDKIYWNRLADILGFKSREILFKTGSDSNGMPVGFGFLAELDDKNSLKVLLALVKQKLNIDFLVYSGDDKKIIKNIAVINGSGGSEVEKIIMDNDIDCIITGDVGYHHAKSAVKNNVAVIDAGHYGTEKALMPFLFNQVRDYLKAGKDSRVNVYLSESEINPFKFYA